MNVLLSGLKACCLFMVCVLVSLAAWAQPTAHAQSPAFAGWLDPTGTATVETVQDQAAWEAFTGWKGWGFGPEPVWVRVHVPAFASGDAPAQVLAVHPPHLDQVTFYDPVLGVQKQAGDFYPVADEALRSVLFTFEVAAHPQARDVFIRLQSTSTRVVYLSLLSKEEARSHVRIVDWSSGVVLLMSLMFLLWAMLGWWLTRDRLMGLFVVKQVFVCLWGFTQQGFARITIGAWFNEGTLSLISCFVITGFVSSITWFFIGLLTDYKAKPWILNALRGLVVGVVGVSLLNFAGMTGLVLHATNTAAMLLLILIPVALLTSNTSASPPPIPKKFLLIYVALYAAINLLPGLMQLGLIEESNFLFVGHKSLLLLDGFIMLMLLNVRQVRINQQLQSLSTQVMLQEQQARLDQQYLDEQRKLLAMLAHEMKTPLANLRIWMEAGPKGRPVMERAIVDMDRVIERCVHAGQLSDHSLQPRNEWLDASELTQSVLASSRQPGRVTLSLPSDVCAVHTDAQMLSIVLSNVLENAYKYSPPDSPITLQLVPHAGEYTEPGWRWTFENAVGDAGYPEADKVFDKYYRSAAAQRQSGSGLGLFLVKSLLDLMRGQVAYTPLQERVRFEVWVPCDASKTNRAA